MRREGGLGAYSLLALGAFMLGTLVGLTIPSVDVVKRVSEELSGLSLEGLAGAASILSNNFYVAGVVFLGTLLAVPGLLTLAYNGYVLGSFAHVYTAAGKGLLFLAAVLPHGVVEVPGFAVAGGAGLRALAVLVSRRDAGAAFAEAVRGLSIAFLLLFTAAFIEAFITPRIVSLVGLPGNT